MIMHRAKPVFGEISEYTIKKFSPARCAGENFLTLKYLNIPHCSVKSLLEIIANVIFCVIPQQSIQEFKELIQIARVDKRIAICYRLR